VSDTEVRICATSPNVVLDVAAACRPHSNSKLAPIDDYYNAAESITLVGTPDLLDAHRVLGRLLLLGHVSAAETFVRAILVGVLNRCPIARSQAGTQTIPFSSVHYYDDAEIAYGLFDGKSLAGGPEIRSISKKLLDIDMPNKGPLYAGLEKFDALCHLRHAAVHAHGSIGTANAVALGVTSGKQRLSLDIDFARLHEAAVVCRSMVQELNQFLFVKTFDRWQKYGLLVRDYSLDREQFISLYSLFRSKRDSPSKGMRPSVAYASLLK
jgi:hypothetical protein